MSLDAEAVSQDVPLDSHSNSDEGSKEKGDFIDNDKTHPQIIRTASGESEIDPKNLLANGKERPIETAEDSATR